MTALKPRTTTVVLFQGDDLDPLNERLSAVVQAAPSARRIGDSDALADAQRAYDEFADEALDRAARITLQAMGHRKWRDLLLANPPREGDEDDEAAGFNVEEFGYTVVPASIAPGQFDSDRERDDFLDSLSDGDFSKLYSAAMGLNQNMGPDPKARLSSPPAQTSGETSESPARLA